MDQVSAFAAYKNAPPNQNSKKKQKKPNPNANSRPTIVLPTHKKKAKVSKFFEKKINSIDVRLEIVAIWKMRSNFQREKSCWMNNVISNCWLPLKKSSYWTLYTRATLVTSLYRFRSYSCTCIEQDATGWNKKKQITSPIFLQFFYDYLLSCLYNNVAIFF